MLFLLPICIGIALACQTAVNARLRSFVQSPFLTSLISFSIGTLLLLVITASIGHTDRLSFSLLSELPIWIFSGGLLGLAFLTINIVLFKKIGGVQTAVLPIFGQLIMGGLIDQFGLIYAPISEMTWVKALGLLLVACGVVIVTDLLFSTIKSETSTPFIWKVVGVGAGMVSATQAAVNGHLGKMIDSSFAAATISFIVGTSILFVLVLVTKTPFENIKWAIQAGPKFWWIWLGGVLGAFYVFGMAYLVPILGTGQVIVLVLFGQLLCSVCIDQFGLFHTLKKKVSPLKIVSLAVMLFGVFILKLY